MIEELSRMGLSVVERYIWLALEYDASRSDAEIATSLTPPPGGGVVTAEQVARVRAMREEVTHAPT